MSDESPQDTVDTPNSQLPANPSGEPTVPNDDGSSGRSDTSNTHVTGGTPGAERARERAERGAAFLTELYPEGWRLHIKRNIRVAFASDCPLAQVTRGRLGEALTYEQAQLHLGLTDQDCIDLGFTAASPAEINDLNDAWNELWTRQASAFTS